MGEEVIVSAYANFIQSVPYNYQFLVPLAIFTLLFLLYSLYSFSFYKLLAKRDIFELNLKPTTSKKNKRYDLYRILLFILEYLCIMPVLCLLWFGSLSIFLLVFSKTASVITILMLSCALVASIRIIAYISEELSGDLAKIVPLTLLTFFIIGENFFNVSLVLERIMQINGLWALFPLYAIFIFLVEFIMRLFILLRELFVKSK